MENFITFLDSTGFSLLLLGMIIITLIITIINLLKTNRLKKNFDKLMKFIGKGENFKEILETYLKNVENVANENLKLIAKTDNIEKNLEKCLQKIAIVRYSAFLGSGSDLCFALAILDFEDNGVVINGIYSRDNTTTTYAKPIEHGKSKYTLVKEEEEAIEKAMHSGYKCFLDLK